MKLKDRRRRDLQLDAMNLILESDKIKADNTLLPGIKDKKLDEISAKIYRIKQRLENLK